MSAVRIEDGIASIKTSGKAVELELHSGEPTLVVYGEDVDALNWVRGTTEAGGDPLPDDLVTRADKDVLSRGREGRVVLRLEDPVALALNRWFAELFEGTR